MYYRLSFKYMNTIGYILILAGFIISASASRAGDEPTKQTNEQLQRATEIAESIGLTPSISECPFKEVCRLADPGVGSLVFDLRHEGYLTAGGTAAASGHAEVKACAWIVAFLTGLKDLDQVESIARTLLAEVEVTGNPATSREYGARIKAERPYRYIDCQGERPL